MRWCPLPRSVIAERARAGLLGSVAAQEGREALAGGVGGDRCRGGARTGRHLEGERDKIADAVLAASGGAFDGARAGGRVLDLADAIAFAASD